MVIYCCDGIRVLQHDYLKIYYVQQWMECDNPRSYGRHYDYCTILVTESIEKVNAKVYEMRCSNETRN